jgi:hypothetical protein
MRSQYPLSKRVTANPGQDIRSVVGLVLKGDASYSIGMEQCDLESRVWIRPGLGVFGVCPLGPAARETL